MTSLRSVNLNLLPILRALLRRASVTQAARELNMSQPAVSDALAKLRLILHDELLIPSGRTYALSALANRLLPQVEEVLDALEEVFVPQRFEPARGVGTIRIATSDYIGLAIGPHLARMFADQAPLMSFEIADTHLDSAADLRRGEIDLIIAPIGQIPDENGQFGSMPLFKEEFVYLVGMKDGRPCYSAGEDLPARPHVFYQPRGRRGFMAYAETLLRQHHSVISEFARVPSFLLIPFLIEGTDNVALLQRRVAERMMALTATTMIAVPELNTEVQMIALWNRSRERDPAHAWLRAQLAVIAQSVAGLSSSKEDE